LTLILTLLFVTLLFNLLFSFYYVSPSRYSVLFNTVCSLPLGMCSSLYKYLFSTLLLFIFFVNLAGNIPGFVVGTTYYYFTSALSLSVWVRLMLVVFSSQLKLFVSHLLPLGSPLGLMLILPLIELFSHLIRPLTLMIRLSTNLSSGHILLYIFSFFSVASFKLTALIFVPLLFLMFLEFVVSALQAYIFSSLAFIYISETLSGDSWINILAFNAWIPILGPQSSPYLAVFVH